MRGQTSVMLLAIAALTVACTLSTETPSAPTTSTTTPAVADPGPTVVTPLLASVIPLETRPGTSIASTTSSPPGISGIDPTARAAA